MCFRHSSFRVFIEREVTPQGEVSQACGRVQSIEMIISHFLYIRFYILEVLRRLHSACIMTVLRLYSVLVQHTPHNNEQVQVCRDTPILSSLLFRPSCAVIFRQHVQLSLCQCPLAVVSNSRRLLTRHHTYKAGQPSHPHYCARKRAVACPRLSPHAHKHEKSVGKVVRAGATRRYNSTHYVHPRADREGWTAEAQFGETHIGGAPAQDAYTMVCAPHCEIS